MPGLAPLRECLAAGIVMATGYDGSGAFVNPMCGSGTLAIEAALIGRNITDTQLRSGFSASAFLLLGILPLLSVTAIRFFKNIVSKSRLDK